MSNIVNATEKDFKKVVLESKLPVLVDFWAAWCGPCKAMEPILDELSVELKSKLKIVKVNIEDPANLALAQKYQILSIPNMKLFKNGKSAHDFIGFRPKETLQAELERAL
jgi:thioredoxin 1